MLSEPETPAGVRRLAVFADFGDTAHAALYTRVAKALAGSGVEIVLYGPDGIDPALLDSLLENPGAGLVLVSALTQAEGPGIRTVQAADPVQAREAIIGLADALIGLPSRLGPAADLYATWVRARELGNDLPVGLLNHKKAFDVIRGFAGDVAGVGFGRTDHIVQFSESIDDLIARVLKMATP